jgi:archaellum biogenesis protein FlaJ (TadC family)
MKTLQLISGIALMIIGIGLISVPLIVQKPFSFLTLLYGVPLLIIGIFILNNKEEEIEKIKTVEKHKRK